MKTTFQLSTEQAADRLNTAFGEGLAYWLNRLRNERKSTRVIGDPVPAEKFGGRWAYTSEPLDEWIGAESARRLAAGKLPVTRAGEVLAAFGVGQAGGSSTGRRLSYQITAQQDEQSGDLFIQLMTTNPLTVYRLSADEAHSLAAELSETAHVVARATRVA